MTHVSRKKLQKETKTLLDDLLYKSLANTNKPNLKQSLEIILTKTEKVMVSKRLAIILLLNKGLTIDQIAKSLKTTPQTVERIKMQLKTINSQPKKRLLKRLNTWANKTYAKRILKDILFTRVHAKQIHDIKGPY